MNNTWTVTVEEDAEGNSILPFPKEMLEQVGWLEGDELDFVVGDNDTCTVFNLSWEKRQAELHK
jgi:hypothetical protein